MRLNDIHLMTACARSCRKCLASCPYGNSRASFSYHAVAANPGAASLLLAAVPSAKYVTLATCLVPYSVGVPPVISVKGVRGGKFHLDSVVAKIPQESRWRC